MENTLGGPRVELNILYDASQQATCAVSSALQKMMGIVIIYINMYSDNDEYILQ